MKYLVPLPSKLLVKWIGPVREHRATRTLFDQAFVSSRERLLLNVISWVCQSPVLFIPECARNTWQLCSEVIFRWLFQPPTQGLVMSFGTVAYRWRCFRRMHSAPLLSLSHASLDSPCSTKGARGKNSILHGYKKNGTQRIWRQRLGFSRLTENPRPTQVTCHLYFAFKKKKS